MRCPKCHQANGSDLAEDEDIECQNCKMVYRCSILQTSIPRFSEQTGTVTPAFEMTPTEIEIPDGGNLNEGSKGKRKKPHDEDEEMALFRRVRIKTSIVDHTPHSRPTSSGNGETSQGSDHNANETVVEDKPGLKRVKVYELRNNDWYDRGTGFCTASFVYVHLPELSTAFRLITTFLFVIPGGI